MLPVKDALTRVEARQLHKAGVVVKTYSEYGVMETLGR